MHCSNRNTVLAQYLLGPRALDSYTGIKANARIKKTATWKLIPDDDVRR
jgi:hypothetical protein